VPANAFGASLPTWLAVEARAALATLQMEGV
jgi:hypothetical protein